jgi:hypothetical protein
MLTRIPDYVVSQAINAQFVTLRAAIDATNTALVAIQVTVDALAVAAVGATDGEIQALKVDLDAAVLLSVAEQTSEPTQRGTAIDAVIVPPRTLEA